MKKAWIAIGVVVVLLAIGALTAVGYYNSFVSQTQRIDNQWAQVQTQYQRRFDLIPNLVAATKGIFGQEQKVFGQLAEARTRYAGARGSQERVQAANQLESALARLLVIVENYPQLRSSESVQTLMIQLEGTENRISVERRRYNDEVRDYNTAVKRVPGVLYAGVFGFEPRAYFRSQPGAEAAPRVEFSD